jgi:hypothetical protein
MEMGIEEFSLDILAKSMINLYILNRKKCEGSRRLL